MISYWGIEHGEVSKKEKKDWSGTAVGTGATVGTVGLVGGGVPGARPDSGRLAHVKHGTKYEASRHYVSAARGGIFGYRADAHQSFLNRQEADEKKHGGKKTTRVNHFMRGSGTGKIGPEKVVINHMKAGRAASNVALVAGTTLAGAGAYKHHKNKEKVAKRREDHKAEAVAAGGATTAAVAGGGSLVMDSQGRKWAKRAAGNYEAAHKMNPKMGGFDVRTTKHRVPDVKPHLSTGDIARDHKNIFAGRSSKHAEAAGKLRGTATQERYFASVYGKTAKAVRKVGLAGAVVGAAGLGAKHYEVKRKVKKNLAMPKRPGAIPGIRAAIDYEGKMFKPPLSAPGATRADPQRVLHTVRRPKRKLVRSGARQRVGVTGAVGKALFPSAAKPVGMVKPKAPTGLTPPDLFAPKMGGASKMGGAVKPKPVMAPLKPKPMTGMSPKPAGMKPKPAFR